MRLIYAELAKAQFTGNFTPTYTTAEAHAFIDSVPTVDAQPVVHSRWEISSDGYYPYCKNCNAKPESGKMTKYCAECGARMDGETK